MDFLRQDFAPRTSFYVSEIPGRAKMDQNESPMDLPIELKEELLDEIARLAWNRYPQPKFYAEVKETFSDVVGIPKENLFLGVGCDQMIATAFFAAGGRGKRALIFEPTYPMYAHYARLTHTAKDVVMLGPEYEIEDQHLEGAYDLITIVTPNNPTGNVQRRETIERALSKGGLVFVDEAYIDFSGFTVIDLLPRFERLFIGRSLSKSLLAGFRLGYGIAHPAAIRLFEEMHFAPYHMNLPALVIAKSYEKVRPYVLKVVQQVLQQRNRIYTALLHLDGVQPRESDANFMLFKVENPSRIYEELLKRGIRIRNVSQLPGLENYLRITVGRREENDIFIDALEEVL